MKEAAIAALWARWSGSALLWLTTTIVVYYVAFEVSRRSGRHPLANPMLLSVLALVPLLVLTKTPYSTYWEGVQLLHFLVGPATVALALPLHAQLARLRVMGFPLLAALLVGAVTAIASALSIGWIFNASSEVLLSLAPKSTTMPIAMGLTEKAGGTASLTTLTVTLTGISGALMARGVFGLVGVHDAAVRGFALGVTAHAIGTGYALQLGEAAGAFAALGMGLNGIVTTILIPVVLQFGIVRPVPPPMGIP